MLCKIMFDRLNEEKTVSYLNSELFNTLGNLLHKWTSRSVNSSQIYPLFNNSIYDSMCNERWSELMHNLGKLQVGRIWNAASAYLDSITFLGFYFLATSGLNTMEAYHVILFLDLCQATFCPGLAVSLLLLSSDDRMILIITGWK